MFSTEDKAQIAFAIEKAEHLTSGEIRVAIEKNCKADIIEEAWRAFHKLDMHKTKLRNGVLIFIAYHDKQFAIVGDEGINKVVPTDFWDLSKEYILKHFKEGNFVEGVIAGVQEAGNQLKKYFPIKEDDINELPNEVIDLNASND